MDTKKIEDAQAQRPQSEDPDYWDVWTGAKERKIDERDERDGGQAPVPSFIINDLC